MVDIKGIKYKRFFLGLSDIYECRLVLYTLVKRNFFSKNKDAYLELLWNYVTPMMMVLILWGVFTGLNLTDDPYFWAYLCLGVFSFQFILNCISGGCTCIIDNEYIIKKTYFPREICVLIQVIGNSVALVVTTVGTVVLMLLTGYQMDVWAALLGILGIIIVIAFGTGIAMLLSTFTVFVSGAQHLVTTIARMLFWITPIFYALDSTSGWLHTIVLCNPITYFVEFFHQTFYYAMIPNLMIIIGSVAFALVFAMAGILVFDKYKEKFAEMIR